TGPGWPRFDLCRGHCADRWSKHHGDACPAAGEGVECCAMVRRCVAKVRDMMSHGACANGRASVHLDKCTKKIHKGVIFAFIGASGVAKVSPPRKTQSARVQHDPVRRYLP